MSALRICGSDTTKAPIGAVTSATPYIRRGHSYAGEAVKLLFGVAALHEMPYVLIAVNTENRSSQRVCEKLCGVRLGPLAIPPDNDRYLEGERTTYLYRFALPYGND